MVKVDLHIHSALSACAENIMSPGRILQEAHDANLSMLAITDHNASANLDAARKLAPVYKIKLIFGLEVTTWEDIHVLALFDSFSAVSEFQVFVDKHLPELENIPDIYGYQAIYDEHDEIIELDKRLRQVGLGVNLSDTVAEIHAYQGIAIPAHVMRGKFSITSQLGFIDSTADFDLVEIAATRWRRQNYRLGEKLSGFAAIPNSDAHFLNDVGRSYFELPHVPSKLKDLVQMVNETQY